MAISKRQRVTDWLVQALPSTTLEGALLGEGFTRDGTALLYVRKGTEIEQRFKLAFDVGPRYEPTALAHVLPVVDLESPLLGELAKRLVGDSPHLTGYGRPVVVGHQLQNLAPKDHHGQATRWFIYEEAQTRLLLEQVGTFAQTWAIPFLNQYRTVRSLIEGHEQGDERLKVARPLYLYIVAAYLQVGEAAKALGVLEHMFGRPALRKQYANAFNYVRGRCTSWVEKGS